MYLILTKKEKLNYLNLKFIKKKKYLQMSYFLSKYQLAIIFI